MSMEDRKVMALYKAHRGGEWFGRSLESIARHVDGVVVVMSEQAWHGGDLPNNCRRSWEEFVAVHGELHCHLVELESSRQEDQYAAGLECIRDQHGEQTAVLVVDTDEVWEPEALDRLLAAVAAHPEAHYFTSRIYTYLRSPLYQVWPQEPGMPVVALQSA